MRDSEPKPRAQLCLLYKLGNSRWEKFRHPSSQPFGPSLPRQYKLTQRQGRLGTLVIIRLSIRHWPARELCVTISGLKEWPVCLGVIKLFCCPDWFSKGAKQKKMLFKKLKWYWTSPNSVCDVTQWLFRPVIINYCIWMCRGLRWSWWSIWFGCCFFYGPNSNKSGSRLFNPLSCWMATTTLHKLSYHNTTYLPDTSN